jgi:CRP-like cAMP-binding protein
VPGAPLEALHRVPLFANLDQREVAQIARTFKERRFADGETVIKEGLGGAAFFLIESGEAKVSIGGKERATLRSGDYFGEIALIDEGARTATLVAVGELVCYGITLWEFRPLVQGNPAIAWKLLQALAKRLREAEQYEAPGYATTR